MIIISDDEVDFECEKMSKRLKLPKEIVEFCSFKVFDLKYKYSNQGY